MAGASGDRGLRGSEIDRIINDNGFIVSDSESSDDNSDVERVSSDEIESDSEISEDNEDDTLQQHNVGLEDDSVSEIIYNVSIGLIGLDLPANQCDVDEEYNWKDEPNCPKNIIFQGENVGINNDIIGDLNLEIQSFFHFANHEFFELISLETNKYAQQCFIDPNRRRLKSDNSWVECNSDEIKTFFSLCIIMSVVKKPNLQAYWSTKKVIETKIFSEIMSLKRFQLILRFLHFADNAQCQPNDKLQKLRPILDFLNDKYKEVYTPDRDVSVDESLMKFRGRLSYVQFNKSKRARFGIKFYKLCEAKTGYCSAFEIYTGKKNLAPGKLASEEIVVELMDPYLDKGYICYVDNWYSSPSLFVRLLQRNTYAVGTVRSNRKNMPTEMKHSTLEVGESERRSGHGMLALKWMDRKQVYVITTRHDDINYQETRKRVRPTRTRPGHVVMKPQSIIDYNNGMLAVDRHDQVLSYNPIMRRYLKGYKKIFFYLLDMTIFNSYVVFTSANNNLNKKRITFSEYKTNLAEQILESVTLRPKVSPGRKSDHNPMRLHGRHFLGVIPPTPNKEAPTKRCCVCLKRGLRRETRHQCKQCLVALHLEGCFELYHTSVNY